MTLQTQHHPHQTHTIIDILDAIALTHILTTRQNKRPIGLDTLQHTNLLPSREQTTTPTRKAPLELAHLQTLVYTTLAGHHLLIYISINIQLTNPNSLNTQSTSIVSIPNDQGCAGGWARVGGAQKKIDLPFKKTEFFLHIFIIKNKRTKNINYKLSHIYKSSQDFLIIFFFVIFRIKCLSNITGCFS